MDRRPEAATEMTTSLTGKRRSSALSGERQPLLQVQDVAPLSLGPSYLSTRLSMDNGRSSPSSSDASSGRGLDRSLSEVQRSVVIEIGRGVEFHVHTVSANVFLTVACIVTGVAMTVQLPILTSALTKHIECGKPVKVGGSYVTQLFVGFWTMAAFGMVVIAARILNPFFSLKCSVPLQTRAVVGFLAAVALLLMVFASAPGRAPHALQGLALLVMPPFTVLVRRFGLGKTSPWNQLACAFVVVIGLIISILPDVTGMERKHDEGSNTNHIIWTLVYVLSQLPFAVLTVILEHAYRKQHFQEVNSLLFFFWIQIFLVLTQVVFFFTDFIPHFGDSASFTDFSGRLIDGAECFFGSAPAAGNCTAEFGNSTNHFQPVNPDPHCTIPLTRGWMYIVFYALFQFLGLLLIKYSHGAIYMSLISSLIGPISSMFWLLFSLNTMGHFNWEPHYGKSSIFVTVGLAVMVPAVVRYNWLTHRESQQEGRLIRYRLEL